MSQLCSRCGAEMRLVKAGVSKKTGKPYNAFYSCKCGQTQNLPPESSMPTPPPFVPPGLGSMQYEKIVAFVQAEGRKIDELTRLFSYFIQMWKEANPAAAEIHKDQLEEKPIPLVCSRCYAKVPEDEFIPERGICKACSREGNEAF